MLAHDGADDLSVHRISQSARISRVELISDPKSGRESETYGVGEVLEFAVTFTQPVRVNGHSKAEEARVLFRLSGVNDQANIRTSCGHLEIPDSQFASSTPQERLAYDQCAFENSSGRTASLVPSQSTGATSTSGYFWITRGVFQYEVRSTDQALYGPTMGTARFPLTLGANLDVVGDRNSSAFRDETGKPPFPIHGYIGRFFSHKIDGTLDPFAPPKFPDANNDGVSDPVTMSVNELTTGPVEIGTLGATDASDDRLIFTLTGADKDVFLETFTFETDASGTSTVALREGVTLDYEAKSSYSVTVGVSDGKDAQAETQASPTVDATVELTVNVNNLDEPGVVELSTTVPEVYKEITVTIKDPDQGVTGVTWQWARSDTSLTTFTDITGATSTTYEPQPADESRLLRPKAAYRDSQGSGKSAAATTTVPTEDSTYTAPVFIFPLLNVGTTTTPIASTTPEESGPISLTYTLDENVPAQTVVGSLEAWDGNLDEVTYTLGGADLAAFNEDFTFSTSTAVILVREGAEIDYEDRSSYAVTVSVSDGKDGTGKVEQTPTVDATAEVTIAVNNLNEEGVVTFTPGSPLVHVDVTASLEDDDGSVSSESWQWSKADTADGTFADVAGATSAAYAPVLADEGRFLRATVTYTDHHGADQTAELKAEDAIGPSPLDVTLSREALAIEEGGSAGYTVALDYVPAATTILTITDPTDNAKVTAEPATLTFTTDNWSTPQTVTVSAAEDDDATTEPPTAITHSLSGGRYDEIRVPDVTVTVSENDAVGIVLSEAKVTVEEGNATGTSYTVKLATEPSAPVTVTISGHENTDLTISGLSATNTLEFTTTSWNTPRTVKLTTADDPDAADESATLTHSASGGDYDNVSITLPVVIDDKDIPVLVVSKEALKLDEGRHVHVHGHAPARADRGSDRHRFGQFRRRPHDGA